MYTIIFLFVILLWFTLSMFHVFEENTHKEKCEMIVSNNEADDA